MRFSWKRLAVFSGVLGLLIFLAARPAPVSADLLSSHIIRVEEDWSLLVLAPDGVKASPQVSTQMARNPFGSRFVNFHINATDVPTYEEGGLQLQAWQGKTNTAYLTSNEKVVMNTPGELVTWTQYLRLANGSSLKFGISASSSQTWGDFSGMEIDYGTTNTDLSIYSSEYSYQNSGVTFGANRVTSLVLVATRTFYANGTMNQDNTPRVVFSQALDPSLNQPTSN
jgi:hypothetical protein